MYTFGNSVFFLLFFFCFFCCCCCFQIAKTLIRKGQRHKLLFKFTVYITGKPGFSQSAPLSLFIFTCLFLVEIVVIEVVLFLSVYLTNKFVFIIFCFYKNQLGWFLNKYLKFSQVVALFSCRLLLKLFLSLPILRVRHLFRKNFMISHGLVQFYFP